VSGSVKSPMVDGIHPLVCSIFFVVVFSKWCPRVFLLLLSPVELPIYY
jgi:hypothetical protein